MLFGTELAQKSQMLAILVFVNAGRLRLGSLQNVLVLKEYFV